MEFLHRAMLHVALESWQWIHRMAAPCNVIRGSGYGFNGMLPGITWHWIRQVAAPCSVAGDSGLEWHAIEFAQTSAILEFYIWFRFRQHHCSRHVILHQSAKFYPNRTTLGRKKVTSCRFSRWRISAILDFRDPIMGSSKSPIRSSIDSIALNCLVFEKIAFLHFGVKIQDGGSPPSWIWILRVQ